MVPGADFGDPQRIVPSRDFLLLAFMLIVAKTSEQQTVIAKKAISHGPLLVSCDDIVWHLCLTPRGGNLAKA